MFYIIKNSKDGKSLEIKQVKVKPTNIASGSILLSEEEVSNFENIRDYIINDGKLIENIESKLNTLKKTKTIEINHLCKKSIESGFVSDALGSLHNYESQEMDQLNLIGAVSSGIEQPFKCSSNNGEIWSYEVHTSEQLKKLIADGSKVKADFLQRATLLKEQIQLSNSIEDLELITWK